MKFKLAVLTTLVAAAMPMLASSQPVAAAHAPITDMERDAAAHRELAGIRPFSKRSTPLAYGYVNMDGSQASSSGNISTGYNSSAGWYVVQISGQHYYFSSFSTTVTPSLPHNAICDTDSINGTLLVRCFDPYGNPVRAEFGFITF